MWVPGDPFHAVKLQKYFMHRRINAFRKYHFSYIPLTWVFSSRKSNNLINRIHERSLRTIYIDTGSLFQELLQRNRSVSIHFNNIQTLTMEVFKVVNNICLPIMKRFFDFRENRYSIRKFQEMRQQKVNLPLNFSRC